MNTNTKAKPKTITNKGIIDHLKDCGDSPAEFQNSKATFYGRYVTHTYQILASNCMTRGYRSALKAAILDSESVFVIFSYETPIAWLEPGIGWVCTNTRHSSTTDRHQHYLRVALL